MERFLPETVVPRVATWMKEAVSNAGAEGIVFGLSGGIDSAVVAGLGHEAFGDEILGIVMPCFSASEDMVDAELVARSMGIPVKTVDLTDVFLSVYSLLLGKEYEPAEATDPAVINLKPRLRMMTLYFWAAKLNYLVVGTSNRSELEIGYFTKYGDGGVDLMPLAGFVKDEVRQLAKFLGVPESVIDKPPSAGLWYGQTDEGEMGFSYEALDRYIRTGEGDPETVEAIQTLNRKSRHKRQMPPVFQP